MLEGPNISPDNFRYKGTVDIRGLRVPLHVTPLSSKNTKSAKSKSKIKGLEDIFVGLSLCREVFGLSWLIIERDAQHSVPIRDLARVRDRALSVRYVE